MGQQQPRLDVEGALPTVDGDRDPAYRYVVTGLAGDLLEEAGHASGRLGRGGGGDPGQDPGHERVDHVTLVLGAPAVVGPRLGGGRRQVRSPCDSAPVEHLPGKRCARLTSVDGAAAYAAERDACPRDPVALELDRDRGAGRGEVTDAAFELEEAAGKGALRGRDDRLDRDLVVGKRVLERAGDEVADRDR